VKARLFLIAATTNSLSEYPDEGDCMTQDRLVALMLGGACAVVIGLLLLTRSSAPGLSQAPAERCLAIAKGEYDGAERDKLLHVRLGAYVKTGALWQRSYWYCRD
jgi:hypothetical protein